jgi:hypothetical protein
LHCAAPGTASHILFNTTFTGADFSTNPGQPAAADGQQQGITVSQCAAKCAAANGCVMFVFGSSGDCTNCCWLKSAVNMASRATGAVGPAAGLVSYIGIGVFAKCRASIHHAICATSARQ